MMLVGRAVLPLSMFIVVGSVLMLLVSEAGSAAQIISLTALAAGLLATVISIILYRLGSRQDDSTQEEP